MVNTYNPMEKNTIIINGGFHITKPEPIDDKLLGISVYEYLIRVPEQLRYIGLNPIIVVNGVSTKYIFKSGTEDADFIIDEGESNQIQSDWEQTDDTEKDFILHKPTIPSLVKADWNQTDVNNPAYIQNKPSIPEGNIKPDWNAQPGDADEILNKPELVNGQVQSDWSQTDNTHVTYIKNKPIIPSNQVQPDWNATSGLGKILNKPNVVGAPDLSVIKGHLELFAGSESEFISAWATAILSDLPVKITLTAGIYFTASRDFIRTYDQNPIQVEGAYEVIWQADVYTIRTNNIIFSNIVFRTASPIYMTLVGGIVTCNNCSWIDDVVNTGVRKTHFLVVNNITNGVANIQLNGIKHYTQVVNDNAYSLIQPILINNQATFGGAFDKFYVSITNFNALLDVTRFARVLLKSDISNCPYKVTGDETWMYSNDQSLSGVNNISATAQILKQTNIDIAYAPNLLLDYSPAYTIGMTETFKMVRIPTVDNSMIYIIHMPDAASVGERCIGTTVDDTQDWTLEAYDLNDKDLLITHNLNRYISVITVWSITCR